MLLNWILNWCFMGIFSKHGIIKSEGAARLVRQSGIAERMAKEETAQKEQSQNETAFGDKAFFSSQSLQIAYVRLKTRLSEVGAKFDPEMYAAGVTIALAYITTESGFFSDYAAFMLSCFGGLIKPHLLSFYTGVGNAPDMMAVAKTPYEECLKEYAVLMQADHL